MIIRKHTIWTMLVIFAALFTGCDEEEAMSIDNLGTKGPGLHVSLTLGGKQPVYQPAKTSSDKGSTRAASTIEGENDLNENVVRTVNFFLVNPQLDGNGNVTYDANNDTVWVLTKAWPTFTVDGTDITQDMTDNNDNDESPDANGSPVTPDYYPAGIFTLASGKSSDWIASLGLTEGSRLYALANIDWSNAGIQTTDANGKTTITPIITGYSGITTWEDLKGLTITDENIYKKQAEDKNNSGNQEVTDKLFVMDGFYRFTKSVLDGYTADETAEQTIQQVTVDLRRAAAKVRVNIYKAKSWTDSKGGNVSIDINRIEAKVSNYATQSKAIAPEGNEGLGENGHVSTYSELEAYNRRLNDPSGKEYLSSVLFYTFAHNWSDDIGHETTFIMNLPYSSGRDNNWYKIVFIPDGGQEYKRNTFYEVDVTVAYDGSTESYEPEEIKDPTYKVSEWYPEEVKVESANPVDYLILDKYYIDLRNEAETEITFYSSNNVTVEVVHDVEEEIAALGGKENFPWPEGFTYEDYRGDTLVYSTGKKIANIPGIYYPDKEDFRVPIYASSEELLNSSHNTKISYNTTNEFIDQNRAHYLPVTVVAKEEADNSSFATKENSEVYITWPQTEHSERGKLIDVYSAIPRNATLRFITLKVTMEKAYSPGEYITRYVIIKQYPLEYIINQFGYYSFMDANTMHRDIIDGNDSTYSYNRSLANNQKVGDLYKVYSSDLESGKSKWVIIPNEIVNGLGEAQSMTFLNQEGIAVPYKLDGRFARLPNMKCKFYLDGTDKTFNNITGAYTQHTWTDAEGTHHGIIYQISDEYDDGDGNEEDSGSPKVGLDANTPSNNNRMYEVRITATSQKYKIGYPATKTFKDINGNEQLYADPSPENNELVSPHFVIASQLGNSSATPYWEVAQSQCMHYVEVDNMGNVFKDWRLPTIAELRIIKDFQLDDDVFNVTMNRILNSDGDTNPAYWTAGKSGNKRYFMNTTGSGSVGYTDYTGEDLQIPAGLYYGQTIKKYKDSNEKTDVRIRCVRDIK